MLKVKSEKLKVPNGFTLIELLLVVGIVAVVLGFAIPYTLNTKFTNDLDAAANNLITTLKEAQSQAIAGEGDVPYGIYFDAVSSPQKYTLYKGTSYTDRDASFNAGGYGTTELPKSTVITFTPPAWTSSEITFARLTGKSLSANTELSAAPGLKALYHFNNTSGAEANKEGKELALGDLGSGIADSNLKGLWHLNENPASNGSTIIATAGSNGTLITNNGATNKSAAGKFANALSFDGIDDHVNIPSSNNFNFSATGNFSYFMWFKKSTLCVSTNGNEVFASRFGSDDLTKTWWFGCRNNGGLNPNTLVVNIWHDSGNSVVINSTSPINDGVWHYGGWTYDGSTKEVKLYLDGVWQGTASAASFTGSFNIANPLFLGRYQGGSYYADGSFDEAAVYDITLELPVIIDNYRRGIAEDATVIEITGNTFGANDGNIYGAVTTSGNAGFNQALSFDGVDDYVSLGSPAPLNFSGTAPFSIEAFVKPNTASASGQIVAKFNAGVVGQYQFEMSGGQICLFREVSPWSSACSSATLAADGLYHHVAGTYDGTNMRVYVDGSPSGNPVSSGSVASDATTPVHIGSRLNNNSPSNFFNGSIDEVAVWDTALNAEIIATHIPVINKNITLTIPDIGSKTIIITPEGLIY